MKTNKKPYKPYKETILYRSDTIQNKIYLTRKTKQFVIGVRDYGSISYIMAGIRDTESGIPQDSTEDLKCICEYNKENLSTFISICRELIPIFSTEQSKIVLNNLDDFYKKKQ